MGNEINIGIFGLGTVGKGVFSILKKNRELLEKRTGSKLIITKAVVSNINKQREIDLSGLELSDDPYFILDDKNIQIVIELIGDLKHSENIIIEALNKGKSVITANKAVIARKADRIFDAAYKSNAFFGFESSVGSGIPVIRSIREGFAGDKISSISGILNSTTNFILTKMSETGEDFSLALKDAQEKGFAEPDPTFDIEGYDAAHKLVVLMDLSFNKLFSYDELHIEGITDIESIDMIYTKEMGYRIKHIGWADACDGKYYGAVHPILIHEDDSTASVNNAYNSISINTEFGGPFMFHGLGAGSYPAASGVVCDIVEAARYIETRQRKNIFPLSVTSGDLEPGKIEVFNSVLFRYYIRFTVTVKPGVLATISQELGDNNISISSVLQKQAPEVTSRVVSIILITHKTTEKQMQKSLESINSYDFISAPSKLIRIRDNQE